MEIRKSTWQTTKICPHCGQGHPTYCYCHKCGFVTLICEETWDAFKNPRDLDEGVTDKCPNCGLENTIDFETADSNRILKAGFTRQDYE